METFELPQIWERLTDKLSHATSESNMDMYIRQITPLRLENDIIYCSVPSTTLCSAIQQNFLPLISAALKEITDNNNIQVELNIKNHNSLDVPKETYKTKSLFSEDEKSKDTQFQPLCHSSGPGSCQRSRQCVQPFVYLWEFRFGKNTSDARHWQCYFGSESRCKSQICDQRNLYQ